MTHREIALEYLKCYCNGHIEGLEPLLSPNLKFKGTLHAFDSFEAYMAGLRIDPPLFCRYELQQIVEDQQSVAIFYKYLKPGGAIQIAQLFKICDEQIAEILLVFDSGSMK